MPLFLREAVSAQSAYPVGKTCTRRESVNAVSVKNDLGMTIAISRWERMQTWIEPTFPFADAFACTDAEGIAGVKTNVMAPMPPA